MSTTPTHSHRKGETHSNGCAPAAPVQQPDRFLHEGLKAERQRMYAARAVNAPATATYRPSGYDGAELQPYAGRPDAMHAQALPSRTGQRLRYPDGRVTDMAGQPTEGARPLMTTTRYIRPADEMPDIGLDYLLARCAEVDGCLIWKGPMRNGPLTNIGRRGWKVRHLVWNMTHGRTMPRGRAPMPTVCDDERCVHPDHLTPVKRNTHALGKKMTLLHRSHIAQAKRAHSGKITEEQARAIHASKETLATLASQHGISISVAHRIKAGCAWIDYGNPFAQLMGSTA